MGTNLNNGEVVEAPPGSSRTPSGCAASPAPLPRPPPHLGMVVPAGSHVTPLPTEGQFPAGPRPIPAIRQRPPSGPLGALPWGSPERGVLVLRVKVPAAQSWAVQPSGSLLDSKAREVSERRHSRWHRPLVSRRGGASVRGPLLQPPYNFCEELGAGRHAPGRGRFLSLFPAFLVRKLGSHFRGAAPVSDPSSFQTCVDPEEVEPGGLRLGVQVLSQR